MVEKVNIFWFRRDLRLEDSVGLWHALKSDFPVVPIFIFDSIILDKLENRTDHRVIFVHDQLNLINLTLKKSGGTLRIFYDTPAQAFEKLLKMYTVNTVFTNTDYEPYATQRDEEIKILLAKKNISFNTYKDQVIFEKEEVVKDNTEPYTVFTPYSKKWKDSFSNITVPEYSTKKFYKNFHKQDFQEVLSLGKIKFKAAVTLFPPQKIDEVIIEHYAEKRDFPGLDKTSRLGIHLRFGTISIRRLVKQAAELSTVFLNELIWREFYQMILWNFPDVGRGKAFKPAYDKIEWRTDNGEFERWCKGETGYPIVDAGMRQLNLTGFMHNRVRMITASFLCKHLLLDWRLGEAYFAEKLLDYDLASNNGGWQWACGSGCDAAPYFRIFNPWLQTKKFDQNFSYIKKWVPEYQEFTYPKPMVEHEFARKRCLEVYSRALRNQ